MANILFISDYHIGHKNIHKFRCKERGFFRDFEDEGEHRDWVLGELDKACTKRTHLYCLGDMVFSEDGLEDFRKLSGKKFLIKGNHDDLTTKKYLEVFEEVYGLFRYKNFWLSHPPIHPEELRGRPNIHGHVHYNSLHDDRYINICPENTMRLFGKPFATLEQVREYFNVKT